MKSLSGKELAKLLERYGWQLARIRGSHHICTKPDRAERLSVPIHGSGPLKPGLQRHLVKLAGIPEDVVREGLVVYAADSSDRSDLSDCLSSDS